MQTLDDESIVPDNLSIRSPQNSPFELPAGDPDPADISPKLLDGAVSSHSANGNPLSHATLGGSQESIIINDSNHYTHVIVIASEAEAINRRSLIRREYFGLVDNLLPCMRFNAFTMYRFWIYDAPPQPNTPLRHQYEAEKMEWNDLEEQPEGVTFEQAAILEWANRDLHNQGITYDYLIVQDINTFLRLSTIKQEIESGIIGIDTDSPDKVDTNLVWGRFSDDITDKYAFVIGSAAVKQVLEDRKIIPALHPSLSSHLLTTMYNYYQASDIKGLPVPQFVRDDTSGDAQRFVRWRNNVESVHTSNVAVTMVLQEDEFTELVRWTSLKPVTVCYTRKPTFTPMPPLTDALDDDEDISDIFDPGYANNRIPVNQLTAKEPSIALVTSSYIYGPCMEPSATLSANNKRRYAEKHGHSFVARSAEFAQQKGRRTVWGKVDAIEKVLPKYDWIFWMDMDAVILNSDRSLHAVLADIRSRFQDGDEMFQRDIHLIATRPTRDSMVNAGVFYLRNTPWSMRFLRDLQGMTEWYNKGSAYEQGAMWDLISLPENKKHVFLLEDDHVFNTLPKFYVPGDFIVHFAPDKCPNDAVLKGLDAADRIENGEAILSLDEE